MKKTLLAVTVFSAVLVTREARAAFTTAQLTGIHQGYVQAAASSMDSASRSGDASQYYFTSIDIMGMLSAVEITQDANELQQAMGYIDNMIAAASRVNGHAVWYPLSDVWNFQGAQCIARAAALIWKTPAFKAQYAAKAQAYASFVDDMIFQYWINTANGGQPEWLTGDPADWNDGQQWNDKSWILADICNSLYTVTGQSSYLQTLNQISGAFKNNYLQPLNSGWIWNYHAIPIGSDTNDEAGSVGNQEGSPDTDHANRAPLMMSALYEAGLGGWTAGDLQRLGNTLGETMWNRSTTSPLISNYVDGSNKAYRTHFQAGENGFVFAGWALMGQYSDSAETATEAVMSAILAGASNPTLSENLYGYYKPVGLSGFLLHALAKRQTTSAAPAGPAPAISLLPAAPSGVSTTPGDGQATIQWNPVPGATSYNLYRSRTAGVTPATGYKIAGAANPYVNSDWTNGTAYYMVVTAVNSSGEGPPSTQVAVTPQTQPPLPPSGVTVSAGNGQALIWWNAVSGATSYNLYRSRVANVTTSNGFKIANVSNPYLNTGWKNGAAYYMVVTAVNAAGESATSSEVTAIPRANAKLSAPSAILIPQETVAVMASDLNTTRVYPNPWRADRHHGDVVFDHLPVAATIKLFSLAGRWIRTLSADNNGAASWDLNNDAGDRVASGLYFYLISNQGQQTRGKLAVIR